LRGRVWRAEARDNSRQKRREFTLCLRFVRSLPRVLVDLEVKMSIHSPVLDGTQKAMMAGYLDNLALVERLHRLLLDVIKDEFERLSILEINSVQALLLFNIGENEVTAGELKSRGYYQGSNVSYNLKKLVELGYMHHQRSEIDRRSVRVRLTERGRRVRAQLVDLFSRHAEGLVKRGLVDASGMDQMNTALKRMERYWTEQIRYIY
jgi:DNA-binding MarR family transcriptional regulator